MTDDRITIRTEEAAAYYGFGPIGASVSLSALQFAQPKYRSLDTAAPTDAIERYVENYQKDVNARSRERDDLIERLVSTQEALKRSKDNLAWSKAALAERKLDEG